MIVYRCCCNINPHTHTEDRSTDAVYRQCSALKSYSGEIRLGLLLSVVSVLYSYLLLLKHHTGQLYFYFQVPPNIPRVI
jgi:hypothetical protein